MINLRQITPPTAEPISLETARAQIRSADIGTGLEDGLLSGWITSARETAEEFLEMLLTDAVYEYRVDELSSCGVIEIPVNAVGTVSSITYVDTNGDTQTLDSALYVFDNNLKAPAVRLAYQQSWPSTRAQSNAIVITLQGYYGTTWSPPLYPPQPILSAMQQLIHDLYQHRGELIIGRLVSEIPRGAAALMQPYRRGMGV